jgi:hypothetical protein
VAHVLACTHDDAEEEVRKPERHPRDHHGVGVVWRVEHGAEAEVAAVHTFAAQRPGPCDDLAVVVMKGTVQRLVVDAPHGGEVFGRVPVAREQVEVVVVHLGYHLGTLAAVGGPSAVVGGESLAVHVPPLHIAHDASREECAVVVGPGISEVALERDQLRLADVAEHPESGVAHHDRVAGAEHRISRVMGQDAIVHIDACVLVLVEDAEHLGGRIAETDEDEHLALDLVPVQLWLLPAPGDDPLFRADHAGRIGHGAGLAGPHRIDHDRERERLRLRHDPMVEIAGNHPVHRHLPRRMLEWTNQSRQEIGDLVSASWRCAELGSTVEVDRPWIIAATTDDVVLGPYAERLPFLENGDVAEAELRESTMRHDTSGTRTDDRDGNIPGSKRQRQAGELLRIPMTKNIKSMLTSYSSLRSNYQSTEKLIMIIRQPLLQSYL